MFNEVIYLKRDNLVYADPFLNEFVIKIEGDSFKIVEYKNFFGAYCSKGNVDLETEEKYKLIVKEQSTTSLNTGQVINPWHPVDGIIYEIEKERNWHGKESYKIIKLLNKQLDSTFRKSPFFKIDTLNSTEKWFLKT